MTNDNLDGSFHSKMFDEMNNFVDYSQPNTKKSSYEQYIESKHISHAKKDGYYIKTIPNDEVTYKICCAALFDKGDYKILEYILKHFPQFVDEKLCKIAVYPKPAEELVEQTTVEEPWGTEFYDTYGPMDVLLKYVPEKFKTYDVCKTAVESDYRALKYVPLEILLEHIDICENAINKKYSSIKNILESINKSVFEKHPNICKGKYTLQNLSEQYQMNNVNVVRDLIEKYPDQIEYINKSVRNKHPEILRTALDADISQMYQLTAQEQKHMLDTCKKYLQTNGWLYCIAQSVQVLIPDIVIASVQNNIDNIKYMASKLQEKHPELCIRAINQDIHLLKNISLNVLKNNMEICKAALDKNAQFAIDYFLEKGMLKNNQQLCQKILEVMPMAFSRFPGDVKTKELSEYAMDHAPAMVFYVDKKYATQQRYYAAISLDPFRINQVPKKFLTPDFCKIALEHGTRLEYVPKKFLESNPELCELGINNHSYAIESVPESIQIKYPYICKMSVAKNPRNIQYVKPSVQMEHPEICQLALAQAEIYGPEESEILNLIDKNVLKQYWDLIHTPTITCVNSKQDLIWAAINKSVHRGR